MSRDKERLRHVSNRFPLPLRSDKRSDECRDERDIETASRTYRRFACAGRENPADASARPTTRENWEVKKDCLESLCVFQQAAKHRPVVVRW